MAHIPSFEELLSEVQESLGLTRDPRKMRFVELKLQLDNHTEMAKQILTSIFVALDMDEHACRSAEVNIMEWANFHKALELRTWTGNASQQQVLWHLLAYSYVPALARHLAFWTLHNIENHLPRLDAGMPGGKFWFLPNWDKEANRIELPVPQVVAWLLDLLGAPPLGTLRGALGNKRLREKEGNDSVVRTLHNWLKDTTPKSAEKIEQTFPDDSALNFDGVFSLDEAHSTDQQFQSALDFVALKKLSPEALCSEIPVEAEGLKSILNGSAPGDAKREFVRLIAVRYAKPEMRTIRQRLRVARMMQDGYQRLLNVLCPGVEVSCTDPARNKLLQLIGLFRTIFSRTIKAGNNGSSVEEQDARFEAQLPPWAKEDLLLSILPSLEGEVRCSLLADRLTRQFMNLAEHSPLEDLVPLSEEDIHLD